jgi:hypothetical protein
MNHRGDIKTRIRIAEGLRLDKKYRLAVLRFEEIENENEGKDFAGLEDSQRRWVYAHHGAATLAYFIPHTDSEGHLDEAERLLRLAVLPNEGPQRQHAEAAAENLLRLVVGADPDWAKTDIPSDDPCFADKSRHHYPWAWAKLGEVFRVKGNLPPFDFPWVNDQTTECDKVLERCLPRLFVRTNERYYLKGWKCFYIASQQRVEKSEKKVKGYPWAEAHAGALLINSRRFDFFCGGDLQFDPPLRKKETSAGTAAKRLLRGALEPHNFRYAWALFHKGGAELLEIIDRLILSLEQPSQDPYLGDDGEQALLMAYDLVVALVDDTSSLYRYPMHPGAIGKDEYLTIAHDLLDHLPRIRQDVANNVAIPNPDVFIRFSRILEKTLRSGFNFLREDELVPGSELFRFAYTAMFEHLHIMNSSGVLLQWLDTKTSELTSQMNAWQDKQKALGVDAENIVDPLVLAWGADLRATKAQSVEVDKLKKVLRESPFDELRRLFDKPALCSERATTIFHETALPDTRVKRAPNDKKKHPLPPNSRDARKNHDADHAQCGVLLRLFDMMMILLKFAVFRRRGGHPTTEVEHALGVFNKELDVLKHGEDGKVKDVREIVDIAHRLAACNEWLLAPQWALTDEKRRVVAEFLNIRGKE